MAAERWDGWSLVLFGGDFSEILDHQERSTGARHSVAIEEFRDFINYFALMDLPLRRGV